ncbi:Uncharacterised protein [Mycolicibacterium aurum]|uniref:Uncharacterized protein n=1 Tax=Mycolicibacterium aurum TaxID=1791 RepID=A0A3S4VNH0_MYCAU|nr:Uncharacterised protein [Mycolicibacterium aurum]
MMSFGSQALSPEIELPDTRNGTLFRHVKSEMDDLLGGHTAATPAGTLLQRGAKPAYRTATPGELAL